MQITDIKESKQGSLNPFYIMEMYQLIQMLFRSLRDPGLNPFYIMEMYQLIESKPGDMDHLQKS